MPLERDTVRRYYLQLFKPPPQPPIGTIFSHFLFRLHINYDYNRILKRVLYFIDHRNIHPPFFKKMNQRELQHRERSEKFSGLDLKMSGKPMSSNHFSVFFANNRFQDGIDSAHKARLALELRSPYACIDGLVHRLS